MKVSWTDLIQHKLWDSYFSLMLLLFRWFSLQLFLSENIKELQKNKNLDAVLFGGWLWRMFGYWTPPGLMRWTQMTKTYSNFLWDHLKQTSLLSKWAIQVIIELCAAAVENIILTHTHTKKKLSPKISADVLWLSPLVSCLSLWSCGEIGLLERRESLRDVVQSLFCEGITVLSLIPHWLGSPWQSCGDERLTCPASSTTSFQLGPVRLPFMRPGFAPYVVFSSTWCKRFSQSGTFCSLNDRETEKVFLNSVYLCVTFPFPFTHERSMSFLERWLTLK